MRVSKPSTIFVGNQWTSENAKSPAEDVIACVSEGNCDFSAGRHNPAHWRET
jgi:hypothetical protein